MTDSELLDRLHAALVRPSVPPSPPPASVQDLHRAIDAARHGSPPKWARRPRTRFLTTLAAGAMAIVGIVVLVVATSTDDKRLTGPEPSLPVELTSLIEVLAGRDGLLRALERDDAAAVAAESERLREAMTRLDADATAALGPGLADLLDRADAYLDRLNPMNEPKATVMTPSAPPTTRPATSTSTTPGAATVPATTGQTTPTAPAAVPTNPGVATGVTAPAGIPGDDGDDAGGGDDNSGPGGGDDNSGPGGGDGGDDDNSGHGGGGSD